MKTSTITRPSANPLKRKFVEEKIIESDSKSTISKDTWVFKGKEFKMIEGKVPSAIASAFTKPTAQEKVTAPYDYDRTRLSVYCVSSVHNPTYSAKIELVKGQFLADVTSEKNKFKISVHDPEKEKFPLTATEFLKAVHAAKLDLYEDSDDSEGKE